MTHGGLPILLRRTTLSSPLPTRSTHGLIYLFVSQNDLAHLMSATIEPMMFSDHHPVTMVLRFQPPRSGSKIWRYNPATLKDPFTHSKIASDLKTYFKENDMANTSPLMQWEAHKCVVRGKLIALTALHKRRSQQHILELLSDIKRLETSYKLSLNSTTLEELTLTRALLHEVLGLKVQRRFILSQKVFYEFRNKSGRPLARSLCRKAFSLRIHLVKHRKGRPHSISERIATEF